MDWLSLMIGIAIGIVANLLTPSVQRMLADLRTWSGTRLNRLGKKSLRLRLSQLEEEHAYIVKLKSNLPELIGLVTSSVMAVLFVTFAVILITFFLSVSGIDRSSVSMLWFGFIGGILGLGTRWLIGALLAWSTVDKVREFEEFEKKNLAVRHEIEKLLTRYQQEE